MSLCKEQIEHLERYLGGRSSSRRWRKKQFSRFMRRKIWTMRVSLKKAIRVGNINQLSKNVKI